ncbi:Kazal-type serine protease inhibitor domain-containing protein [Shinella pollutisoli]|uniref:Kazal-type serine protease inhibitor domain-containing protein n=1 Tax=Shinella pollutisoli TaxID=2250594 RepID=A0ABV7DPY8_9HYPH|nr:Kazal-type serine protease inhibitor domain-containing protein [Shinella pollutisoli]
MPILSTLFRPRAGRIVVALAGLVLAACSVDVADPNAGGGFRPSPGRACTAEYRPVCAARGGDSQTFANACEAQASGFRVLGPGECRHGRPEPRPDESRACTREYAPVCAARGRERQTFANACEARASGYDILGRGECQVVPADRNRNDRGEWREGDRERDGRDRDRADRNDRSRGDRDRDGRDRNDRGRDDRAGLPRDQRVCTSEYKPVCGQQGRDRRTFGNACAAEVAGFRVVRPGECPAR